MHSSPTANKQRQLFLRVSLTLRRIRLHFDWSPVRRSMASRLARARVHARLARSIAAAQWVVNNTPHSAGLRLLWPPLCRPRGNAERPRVLFCLRGATSEGHAFARFLAHLHRGRHCSPEESERMAPPILSPIFRLVYALPSLSGRVLCKASANKNRRPSADR